MVENGGVNICMCMYMYMYFRTILAPTWGVDANFGSKSSGVIYAILLNLQNPQKNNDFSMFLQVLEGQVEPK